jgi:predicted nucleic acid-binding protein
VFVVDTSVTMAWRFADQATSATEAILDRLLAEPATVPAIWRLEVSNVLLVAERRGRITEAQASRFLQLLFQLPITVDVGPTDPTAIVAIGRRHELSAYDAAYLLRAEQRGVSLATLDRRLTTAAESAGVSVLIGA